MRTVVTAPITHLCPHVDEVDVGTVTLTFDGPAPELHALARDLDSFHTKAITHEDLTERLAALYPTATVVTTWATAGLTVECSA